MKDKALIITITVGVIMVGIAAFLGIKTHKSNTPDIACILAGEGVGIEAEMQRDTICVSADKTVTLIRSFSYPDLSSDVVISVDGKWKEKPRFFELRFNTRAAQYISEDNPQNSKGKKISPKQFLNKTARIPKKGIKSDSALVLLKNKKGEKTKWSAFYYHKQ